MNIFKRIARLFKKAPPEKYPGFPIRIRVQYRACIGYTFGKHLDGKVVYARLSSIGNYHMSSDSVADVVAAHDNNPHIRAGVAHNEGYRYWSINPDDVEVLS